LVENVALTPLGGFSLGAALPPISVLLPALVIVTALYGSLRRSNLKPWHAAAVGLALAALGTWALVMFRYPTAFYLRPLAVVMLLGLAMALLADWSSSWLFAKLDIPLVNWLRHALVLTFLVGFWLKAGGLVFPYMQGHDIEWHMNWVRRLLSGEVPFGLLFGTGSPLNEGTMPVDEWGANRPVIPYSPFFQFFAVGFAIFPWKLETTSDVLSVLLDGSRIFLIALIARKSGLSNRATLLAALLYAATPATFVLLVWGNAPTTMGLWLTLVATTTIIVLWERLRQPGPFVLLAAVSLLCMLFYTVTAAFHLFFVLLFALMAWLLRSRFDARPALPMLLATLLGFGVSVLIYYGQYILPVLTITLPYLGTIFSRGSEAVGVERPDFAAYMLNYLPHVGYWLWPGRYLYYGLALPLLAVIPGFVLLRDRQPLWAAMAAWFSVALLFMLVGYRLSMVDKQLFYILPPICLCTAVVAERIWARGRWAQALIVMIYVLTFASAVGLWLIRIARSSFGL
ncbi:MAG: hypothetical protein H7Z42_00530, partial [Roseiflexaceae bacterium]|nr:hypothetical protein [Roseiflexaceae bacterium]